MPRPRLTDEQWQAKEAARAEREALSLVPQAAIASQQRAIEATYARRRYARARNRFLQAEKRRLLSRVDDLI